MIIRTSIREPMALPKGDESHLLVQESNDKKLGRIVTRQCSNRVTYQLSINTSLIGLRLFFYYPVLSFRVIFILHLSSQQLRLYVLKSSLF